MKLIRKNGQKVLEGDIQGIVANKDKATLELLTYAKSTTYFLELTPRDINDIKLLLNSTGGFLE
jgi:hypothetical protein